MKENEVKLNLARNEKKHQQNLLHNSKGFLQKLSNVLTESQNKQETLTNSVQSTAENVQKLKNQVEELTKNKNQNLTKQISLLS